jgi:hypothetical protein
LQGGLDGPYGLVDTGWFIPIGISVGPGGPFAGSAGTA